MSSSLEQRTVGRPVLWLAALAFLLYLPSALRVAQLQPDSVEFVDVARHLLDGEGYSLAVKAYHFGGTAVVHDGLQQRAPLYTFVVAATLHLGAGLIGLQVLNALLVGGCVGLTAALGATLFGRRVGLLAGLLASASPVVLWNTLLPMSEALAICLALLATWLVVRRLDAPRLLDFALAGLALGLAYLTRPPMLLLGAPLTLGALLASPCRREVLRPLGALALGAAVLVAPVTLWSLATRGALSYSGQTYLYAVFADTDIRDNAFRRPLTSAAAFITANPGFVVGAIADHLGLYTSLVFLKKEWLLYLLPAWPPALLALARGRFPRAAWPVLLVAAANFLAYVLTWSNFKQRYQLLTLFLLLPFVVDGLRSLGLARIGLRLGQAARATLLDLAVVAVALAWCLQGLLPEYRGAAAEDAVPTRPYHGQEILWVGIGDWVEDDDFFRLLDWIETTAAPEAVLAHPQPWPFTFYTQRPSTLLPRRLDLPALRGFLHDYRVSYVLLTDADRRRLGYQDSFEALRAEGVESTALGAYRVFDTRALWR